MSLNFTPEETRVLGCLLEKQLATPDYYPMTLNAVQLAANQKSSRGPVMALNSEEVDSALLALSRKEFVEQIRVSGGRSFKFRQRLDLRWGLSDLEAQTERDQLAVLAVLALRGPQTLGQVRQRSERLFFFKDLAAVDEVIGILSAATQTRPALVCEETSSLGREKRFTHLFHETSAPVHAPPTAKREDAGEPSPDSLVERVHLLETRVAALEALLNKEGE